MPTNPKPATSTPPAPKRWRLHRPRRVGIPILILIAGITLLLIAYGADQDDRLFALRHGITPWVTPTEGYVIGLLLVLGALYAIIRACFSGEE